MKLNNKYASIDFEFNETSEEVMEILCCCIRFSDGRKSVKVWTYQDHTAKLELASLLESLKSEYIFLAHNVVAEASSFYSLGLKKPYQFKWIDTFAEFRAISNHNHEYMYGMQLIEGRPKMTVAPKPKYEQTEEDKKDSSNKINHSYSQLVFKFLGKVIDTDRKTKMRDIIISKNQEEILAHKEEILEYCYSDTEYLLPCLIEITKAFKKYLLPEDFAKLPTDMSWRGETMARTAVMERVGYPIDYDKLKVFTEQIDDILNECAKDINSQFPNMGLFEWNKSSGTYTRKQIPVKEWIKTLPYVDRWLRTNKKDLSLSLDAFTPHFPQRHSFDRGDVGQQQVRYLLLKQSLSGFSESAKRGSFWDSVGKDQRVRAYLNPYGSLSGRYQPPSKGFLFLKSSWMRSLCVPPKGKMIVGIDYKSEEFLISGLWSLDEAMIQAYMTGDVYLAFAKDSGLVPKTATKATHPKERQSAKSAVLGISYLMTKYGLAIKLTQDLGEEVDEDRAQEFIDGFNEAYSTHAEAVDEFLESFAQQGYHRLKDGWILFADNENFRSVANFSKQGQGGSILRKAIQLSQDAGLQVIIPLHDALYFEVDLNDWEAVGVAMKCMKEAFAFDYLGTEVEELAKKVMLDVEVWSPELEKGTKVVDGQKVAVDTIHIDERSVEEYEKYKRYFNKADWQLL